MQVLQNSSLTVLNELEKILNRGLGNQYINVTLKIFLGLYAAMVAPKLPPSIANLMDNTLVRIVISFIIVFMATKDQSLALLVSLAFIITLQTANKFRLYNVSLSQSLPNQTSWLPSAKKSNVEDVNGEAHTNSDLSDNLTNIVETLEGQTLASELEGSPLNSEFTSEKQFESVQNNNISLDTTDSCIKSLENQHCTQGFSQNNPDGSNL